MGAIGIVMLLAILCAAFIKCDDCGCKEKKDEN